jgi:uncharacterized membrane protein YdjX (TVP38/TMEM64 family)
MNFLNDLLETIRVLIQENIWLAPLFGVLLPFAEAIIPSFPLTVIVAFNLSIFSTAFGVLEGTILAIFLSVLGSFLGMFLIFIIIRVTVADRFMLKVRSNKFGRIFLNVVEGKNTWVVLALLSNPFLPSSILNYALSLTKVKVPKNIFLTVTSRLIIILFLIFLGSIFDIQSHPLNVLWMMLVYFILLGVWVLYLRASRKRKNSVFKDEEESERIS